MSGYLQEVLEAYESVRSDGAYAEAVKRGDAEATKAMLVERASAKGYGKTLWRVDDNETPRYSFRGTDGVFFAESPEYYEHSDTGYSKEDAKRFLMKEDARLFDPMREIDGISVKTWSWITMRMEDMERLGIEDETDWEEDEGLGNTSTYGLASAGRRMGYEGTVFRDIPNDSGWGEGFTEYAFYDSNCVKLFEPTYDDGGLIPLSKRFDYTNIDMRY